MLTFFSLQSTNRMLFFAFADSFLIRTCLGILFCLSSHVLKLHKRLIFHLSNVLYTLSFLLGLLISLSSHLLCHYCHQVVCYSLFSPPHEMWGMWFCMSQVLLLCWVCVWAVIRLRIMMDRELHGSLCFTWAVRDCVSAGGVVGPVSHSLFPLQQLLQEPL